MPVSVGGKGTQRVVLSEAEQVVEIGLAVADAALLVRDSGSHDLDAEVSDTDVSATLTLQWLDTEGG